MIPAAPVGRVERIVAIDVLRGFALLGILVANITLFDLDGFDAVEQSFDDLVIGSAGTPFMVVLLTDGEPTIGVTIPEDIEKLIRKARLARSDADDVRLFVFGIGSDLNAGLLDRIVEESFELQLALLRLRLSGGPAPAEPEEGPPAPQSTLEL